jgi:hypothetical protein
MNLAWVTLDGTNSTSSTLGTNTLIRVTLFRQLVRDGHRIHWFGLKAHSHLLDGQEEHQIVPHYDVKKLVQDSIKKYQAIWDSGQYSPTEMSMSKWVASNAIEDVLAYLKNYKKMPKVDAVFLEYMDNGFAQIVYFATLLIWFAKQKIPIYVRDTEHRFRYLSELKALHDTPRRNMYEHRLERYILPKHVRAIRGTIRMVYAHDSEWDDLTGGFYRGPTMSIPVVYDETREIPLRRIPPVNTKVRAPIIYIGNDNRRRAALEQWFTRAVRHKIYVYGNWKRKDPKYTSAFEKANPKVKFGDPIPQETLIDQLSRGLTTFYLQPKDYIVLGQITDRVCEAALAGTIMLVPREVKVGRAVTARGYGRVRDVSALRDLLREISGLSNSEYRAVVEQQRKVLRTAFGAEPMYEYFKACLREDGVKI